MTRHSFSLTAPRQWRIGLVASFILVYAGLFAQLVYAQTPDIPLQIPVYDSSGVRVTSLKGCTGSGSVLSCGALAQYIKIVYEWLVRAAAIFATAMIAWGGFMWLTAGGNTGRLGQARTIIANALTGLVLALGSYTLLYTINPKLMELGDITPFGISGKQMQVPQPPTPPGVCCYAVTQYLGAGGGTPVASKIKHASPMTLDKCKDEIKPGLGSGSVIRTVDAAFYCSNTGVPPSVSSDALCWKLTDPANTESSTHCTNKTPLP